METSRLLGASSIKLLAIRVVLISFMAITISGCASMLRIDGPYEGKVIDSVTKQPVEGAVVHGTWYKVQLGGAHEYYDSYEVLTDKNGKFKIPGKGLLVLSEIEGMTLIIFKEGYKQWTPNLWSGLREGKWADEEVVWNGNRGTFKLQPMTMEARKKRGIDLPLSVPDKKQRLLRNEYNKEMIGAKRTTTPVFPEE